MDVIKQNANNFKVLHPALLVIKLSAGSSKFCITQRYSFERAHSFAYFNGPNRPGAIFQFSQANIIAPDAIFSKIL
jgi:hypothetical protein